MSADEGISWQVLNAGLSGLGSMTIPTLEVFNGSLYCGTAGAGTYRLNGSTWQPFGTLQQQTASNVFMLQTVGDTLWAGAGGNGLIWYTTAGASEWTPVQVGAFTGEAFMITALLEVGNDLLLGSTYGVYRSLDGGLSWAPSNSGMTNGGSIRLVQWGDTLFATNSTVYTRIYSSTDNGNSWVLRYTFPLVYAMAAHADRLYASRLDGLWYLSAAIISVAEQSAPLPIRVFPVPTDDRVSIVVEHQAILAYQLMDIHGRVRMSGMLRDGRAILELDGMASGVYVLCLEGKGVQGATRLVRR